MIAVSAVNYMQLGVDQDYYYVPYVLNEVLSFYSIVLGNAMSDKNGYVHFGKDFNTIFGLDAGISLDLYFI